MEATEWGVLGKARDRLWLAFGVPERSKLP